MTIYRPGPSCKICGLPILVGHLTDMGPVRPKDARCGLFHSVCAELYGRISMVLEDTLRLDDSTSDKLTDSIVSAIARWDLSKSAMADLFVSFEDMKKRRRK